MQVGIISDIHVDISETEAVKVEDCLIRAIKDWELESLIIAGDISNDYQKSLKIIDKIYESTGCRLMFVPGNHDLWNKDHQDMFHTQEIYEKLSKHPFCLCGSPKLLGDNHVVIGDIGWYDYTYGSEEYDRDTYLKGLYKTGQWSDMQYVHWHVSDEEKTQQMVEKLKAQIALYPDKKIIFVTHMITSPRVKVPEEMEGWDYFNGFLGSNKFKNLWNDQVDYVIMGHVHFRKRWTENQRTYICACLNYRSQWRDAKKDAYKNIMNTLQVIDI